jgi:hypothetical protein
LPFNFGFFSNFGIFGNRESQRSSAVRFLGTQLMAIESAPVHPQIRKGIDSFLKYLELRNSSGHTLRAYRNELDRLAEYLGPEIRWKQVDHTLVRGFLSHLHAAGLSKVSVARALAAVRSSSCSTVAGCAIPNLLESSSAISTRGTV